MQRLVETFNFHIYDSLTPQKSKLDPRRRKGELRETEVTSVMYAAKAGAQSTLQRYKMSGMDIGLCNYDGRTPLHVAAAEGHHNVVKMLLDSHSVDINFTDR
jgi:glutaminase